jgi:hypothetical protein
VLNGPRCRPDFCRAEAFVVVAIILFDSSSCVPAAGQVPRSPFDGCFLCLYFFAADCIAPSPVTFRVCSVRAVLRASNLRCSPLFYCEPSSFPGLILAGRRPPPLLRLPLVSQPAGRVCTALHSVFPVSGLSGQSGVHCPTFSFSS